MSLQPRVGDTVIIEGIVETVFGDGGLCIRTHDCMTLLKTNARRIKKIIPAPWVPKIGDTVWAENSNWHGDTLIHIHNVDGRAFAVISFKGDIPKSMWLREIYPSREARDAACAA